QPTVLETATLPLSYTRISPNQEALCPALNGSGSHSGRLLGASSEANRSRPPKGFLESIGCGLPD
ncbi:MAG: hypothetical protein ACKOX7_09755, partial [Bacteroidota bacterium]